jgi:hypothetical protein
LNRPNLPVELGPVLERDHVEFFMLVKLEFDFGDVFISGADFDVTYDGEVWTSLRGLGTVDPVVESGDEIPGLSLTLSGVPFEAIVEAQTEPYRGRKVTLKWAFFDGDILRVDQAAWQGFMDVPIITREKESCTIQISAENRMIDWRRPRGLLFNHADQQRVAVGDNFFLGIESMVEREVVLFLAQSYDGGGGGEPINPGSGTIPDVPPPGVTYNIDIINAYQAYYNRRPDISGYNGWIESGLYGANLMIAILAASAAGGAGSADFDTAVARGWDPNNAAALYYPSDLHPAVDPGDWVNDPSGIGGDGADGGPGDGGGDGGGGI